MPIPKDPGKQKYLFSDDMKFLQKAVVLHPHGEKILALRRWLGDKSRPGKWDLPGGNLLFGQVAEDGLRREIKEETGLDVKDIKPIIVRSKFFEDTGVYHLYIGYSCIAVADNVRLSEEHIEYRWVTKEEFLQLDSADFLIETIKLL